jgi:hypothetical protein
MKGVAERIKQNKGWMCNTEKAQRKIKKRKGKEWKYKYILGKYKNEKGTLKIKPVYEDF